LLEWFENSALARMVQESMWGYPIVLSSHAVGMAILVGLALMINFRVLGLAPKVPLAALKTMFRIAWVGLVINVVSGTMLFVANADAFFQSTPFWLKISLLVVGITLLVMLSRRIPGASDSAQDYVPTRQVRWIAFLSSVALFGVIVFGRLIAYWDWKDF
jgi:hypothetical protein